MGAHLLSGPFKRHPTGPKSHNFSKSDSRVQLKGSFPEVFSLRSQEVYRAEVERAGPGSGELCGGVNTRALPASSVCPKGDFEEAK